MHGMDQMLIGRMALNLCRATRRSMCRSPGNDGNYENDSYAAIEYNDASEYDDTFAEDYVGYFVEWGLDFEDEEAWCLSSRDHST